MIRQDPEKIEREIREQLEARDLEKAAELALSSYGPEILGYLVRVMGRDDDAEEVYARFCAKLWRGLPRFRGKSSFRTWAYRLARNARNTYWSDAYRRLGQRLDSDELAKVQAVVHTTTQVFRKTEMKDRLAEIRAELEPDERELLILRVDRRMPWQDIACILEAKDGPTETELRTLAATARQRFKRLHVKLRRLFEERGLIESDEAGPRG